MATSSDSSPSQVDVAALAKTHMGYPTYLPTTVVPKSYLEELKHHIAIYPHDTNFRIELQPRKGFGVVTCLEVGCGNMQISLLPRVKVHDGGKRDGLGSLSTYRAHVADHPTHKKSRLTRIKNEESHSIGASGSRSLPTASLNPDLIKKESTSRPSLLTRLDANFGSSSSTPTLQGRTMAGSSIKPEPSESSIPRKRLSDTLAPHTVTKADPFPFDEFNASSSPPPNKKVKAEVPKMPLAQVNWNTASSIQVNPTASSMELTRATVQLDQVQRMLTRNQADFNKLVQKRRKKKAELVKFGVLSREIDRLQDKKNEYNTLIASLVAAPVKAAKPEPMQPTAGPSRVISHLPPQPLSGFQNPAVKDHKPVVQAAPPLASGSNLLLPNVDYGQYGAAGMDMDDGIDDLDLPDHLLASLGPVERASGYGENFDADGNFQGRGRDTFVGQKANADDIDKFLIAAGNSEQFDGNASVDKALEKLGLQDQYQPLPGMTIALMAHQIIGVAWMLDKETGPQLLEGGILADEMGLGKTVQMISTIVKNRSNDPAMKTTLIVAPTALLDQWKLEIETKTNIDLQCHIYHGPSKAKKKKDLLNFDIVLTTYTTLALEWPDLEAEEKAAKKKAAQRKKPGFTESDSEEDLKQKRKKRREKGLLFQVEWFRIVLDEAQNIRNKRTRNARCVTDLNAKYRWCLTGTPITNLITDAFSLLRFLKIRPWYDWEYFNHHIAKHEKKNPTLATNKLQAIFATTLLRRKKDSLLDGKRLIELPEKTVDLLRLEFTTEERAIYQMIEARSQATFNRFLRAGTVLKNYHQVLVLLLRLRQICSHPALIQEGESALVMPEELDESITPELRGELSRAREIVGLEFVAKMKLKLKEITLKRIEAEKESIDAVVEDEECPICMDVFTDAVITPCSHTFCRECIVNVLNGPDHPQDVNDPMQYKQNEKPCPACRSAISPDKLFCRLAFEPTEADLAGDDLDSVKSEEDYVDDIFSDGIKDIKRKRKAKKGKTLRAVDSEDDTEGELDSDLDDFIVQSDEDESDKDVRRTGRERSGKKKAPMRIDSDDEMDSADEDSEVIYGKTKRVSLPKEEVKMLPRFLPSTKMKKMMETLTTSANENPGEKTIIISQWTSCLKLCSDYLTEHGFLHVKYQGDMNRVKRDQVIRVFMDKEKAPIMLMSLKCGGVGLTLTSANRVISLDLAWSEAVESQAFDRVHRLGQTKPVFVKRLVIENTVEDRVLAMQDRKKAIADGSLGEGNGKKIGRLSVRELANLFGLDARGQRIAPA